MVKFNIDRLECSYFISNFDVVDRLQKITMCESETFGFDSEFKLFRYYNSTYKYAFNVNMRIGNDYRLVASLKFDSSQKCRIDSQLIYITYENRVFYEMSSLGFTQMIKDVFGLSFKEVTKLDICCDTPNLLVDRVLKLYKGKCYDAIINGKLYKCDSAATPVRIDASGSRSNPYKTKTFYVLDSEGSTRLRLYSKKKEQEKKGYNKPYQLVDGWETQDRMEIVLPTVKQVRYALAGEFMFISNEMELANQSVLKRIFESEIYKIIRFKYRRSGQPVQLIE